MSRFFFHLHNGIGLIQDEYGRELPDLARVRAEAVKGIRSVVGDEVLNGRIDLRGRIEVVDEEGKVVATVTFEEAFETTRGVV
jgi:hypothetical protein